MKLTYQDVLDDPSLIRNILAAAHRERANAMHELIVLPIARLFTPAREAGVLRMGRCSNPIS